MILDSYFGVACVLLLAGLIAVVVLSANEIRRLCIALQGAEGAHRMVAAESQRWCDAYWARSAQLNEARTRIDTLEGELTAQDISHSKAIRAALKNDHRDAKGRYAPAHDPYVNR